MTLRAVDELYDDAMVEGDLMAPIRVIAEPVPVWRGILSDLRGIHMKQRRHWAVGLVLLLAAALSLAGTIVTAQAARGGAQAAAATQPHVAGPSWTAQRTPWGDPNLQGIWLNATITPLERPADLKLARNWPKLAKFHA